MKKNYFLTLFLTLVTSLSFGQIVTNGDFETWSGGVLGTWTSESGTTIEQETTTINGGANSAKFTVTTQSQGNTDFRQTVNVTAGKVYDVSVWVYQADNAARARLYVDGYQGYSDPSSLNTWQEITYEYTATTTGTIDVGLRFYDISSNWAGAGNQSIIYIDDYTITEQVSTDPTITLTSPTSGTSFNPGTTSVNVEWVTNNVTSETVDIVVNGARTSGVSSPFSVTTTDGQSYSVSLELLDGSNVTDTATTNFSVGSLSQVANIGALRAETEGNNFEITGGVIVTYVTGNSRNQIYIQDATGGILIDDPSGVITTTYNSGDEITGLKGELGSFQTVLQLRPTEDAGAATATGQSFSTTSVTMAQYIADAAKDADQREYESEWIKIESATFADADGTATFDTTTTRNYTINENSDSMVMRINFNDASFNGNLIPQNSNSITGLAGQFGGTPQIYPTELTNIVLGVESFDNIQGFAAFPNPVKEKELTIRSASSDAKKVTLYSLLGRKVFSEKFDGTQKLIDVSSVSTGVYILKVIENDKISTRKLVIE